MDLISDVDRCELDYGQVALWWLGQHSFILKCGKTVLYLDLFLTDVADRRVPPMLRPEDIVHADYVVGSHDHLDHIDRNVWPVLAESCPRARFVVPDLLRRQLASDLKIPGGRFIGLDDGKAFRTTGLEITGIAAAHEFLDCDLLTGQYPYLGYVIEANGCTIYHAGDSCIYEGLQTKLKQWSYDVVLLPINGRDATRYAANCLGNMTYQEAADLAGSLAPRLTIPTHYDMFAANSEDPRHFIEYMNVKYPGLKVQIMGHGSRLVISTDHISQH